MHADKNDCPLPTPDFYSLKYLCAVFAKEGRDVATFDLPGFFLQAENEDLALLKITGVAALVLVESNPGK